MKKGIVIIIGCLVLCMPYDLCKRPGYLEECHRREANRSQPKAPAKPTILSRRAQPKETVTQRTNKGQTYVY